MITSYIVRGRVSTQVLLTMNDASFLDNIYEENLTSLFLGCIIGLVDVVVFWLM
jgi:hypothetical protein